MFQAYLDFLYSIITFIPFTVLDIVVLAIMVVFVRQEKASGLVSASVTLTRYLVIVLISLALYPFVSSIVMAIIPLNPSTIHGILLVVLWMVLYFLVRVVEDRFSIDDDTKGTRLQHVAYGVGCISFMVLVAGVSTLVLLAPVSSGVKTLFTDSLLGNWSSNVILQTDLTIRNVTRAGNYEALNFTATSSQQTSRVDTHYVITDVESHEADEQLILSVLNKQRMKRGLPILLHDSKLSAIAREQGIDIVNTGSISNTSSRRYSLYDRLQADSYYYMNASEIIIRTYSIEHVRSGLLLNAEMRSMVTSPSFRTVGVAVIDYGAYGNLYVITLVQ